MSTPYDTLGDLQATAAKLREALDGFELHGKGEHPAVMADLARLATALTTVNAEIRQAKKAVVREVSKIPLDALIAYLKSLPKDTKDGVVLEMTGADAMEGLL